VGYIQAVAVDIGLLALALGIQARKRQKRGTRVLWAGVILFTVVSTYANLLHGLFFQSDMALEGWAWLVSLRPLVLSGVLPLPVLYLSEIVGVDVNHPPRLGGREGEMTTPSPMRRLAASSRSLLLVRLAHRSRRDGTANHPGQHDHCQHIRRHLQKLRGDAHLEDLHLVLQRVRETEQQTG
jgi:hypothetical protein